MVVIVSAANPLRRNNLGVIAFVRKAGGIRSAGAARHIPLEESAVRLFCSSLMREQLSRLDARRLLGGALRVLGRGGTLWLLKPDLALIAREYADRGDAGLLANRVSLGGERPLGFTGRLQSALVGDRERKQMYDGPSLCRLLESAGFDGALVVPAGPTGAPDPRTLDSWERKDESVYVEARFPRTQPKPTGGTG